MAYWDNKDADFAALTGKMLAAIHVNDDKRAVRFVTSDNESYVMTHYQDCCERVYLEDVGGDLADLIGSPILQAEVSTSNEAPQGVQHEYQPESQTWTFYKLATIKGYVTLRWFGESNGYYSEGVDFQVEAA